MFGSDRRGSSWVALLATLVLVAGVGALWATVFINHEPGGGDAAQAKPSASTSATSSASSSPSSSSADTDEWSMADAREALSGDDSRVLVLGDSTGDDPEEWVPQWADSQEMPVASWSTQSEDGYSSESAETRVWSGSMPDATGAYPLEHGEAMWPAEDPDLVILNYGHAYNSPKKATKGLEKLRKDVAERAPKAPIVVILQNPEADDANADTREAIAEWAQDAGLPTIDIAQAFEESDLLPADLRLDEFHPSPAGTDLWVTTVTKALAS